MNEINAIINCLDKTPVILNVLLAQIPENLYKVRRIKRKWSIHEQVCHLVDAQKILMERFRKFEFEENPLIKSYNPPYGETSTNYGERDIKTELEKFHTIRAEMIKKLRAFNEDYWNREGKHDAFSPYNTKILLTHSLNVDYAHIFSIEQLGLTKPEFENEIITIP